MTYTEAEQKAAAREAVAILTASSRGDHRLVESLIDEQGARLPLVACVMLGFVSGLLEGLDDDEPGFHEQWLVAVGLSVESMPEGA